MRLASISPPPSTRAAPPKIRTFQLEYDADNWKALSFSPVLLNLTDEQRSRVRGRTGPPVFMTLSLELYQPCTVRCHPSDCIAAEPGHETHFDQLRQLASAVTVNLIFDTNNLKEHLAGFVQLISLSRELKSVPTDAYSGPLSRRTDWTVFSPLEENVSGAPPAYAAAFANPPEQDTNRPSKRPRLLSPAPCSDLLPTASGSVAGSPTEKATTMTSSASPPPSLLHQAPELEHKVKSAVEAVLPSALARLFAAGFSTPGVSKQLKVDFFSTIDKLRTNMLNDADDRRAAADNDFFELVGEFKEDLLVVKEDYITELIKTAETCVEETTEICQSIKVNASKDMEEDADAICAESCKKHNDTCMQCIPIGWAEDARVRQCMQTASV